MKTYNLKFYFLALATGFVFMLSSCSKENTSPTINEGDSENISSNLKASSARVWGHGLFTVDGQSMKIKLRVTTKGGVSGSGSLTNTDNGSQIEFDIDCVDFPYLQETAYLSGTITSHTNPAYEGFDCWLFIDDNSFLPEPDYVTLLIYDPAPGDCSVHSEYDLYPIEKGDLRIMKASLY